MEQEFYEEYYDFLGDLDESLWVKLKGTEWEARVDELDNDTPLTERVALYQRIRAAGVLPADAALYLVVWAMETIAEERIDELLDSKRELAEKVVAGRADDWLGELDLDAIRAAVALSPAAIEEAA